MSEELADLIELGFEGFDRLTDRYHDNVYDAARNVRRKKSKQKTDKPTPAAAAAASSSDNKQDDLPPDDIKPSASSQSAEEYYPSSSHRERSRDKRDSKHSYDVQQPYATGRAREMSKGEQKAGQPDYGDVVNEQQQYRYEEGYDPQQAAQQQAAAQGFPYDQQIYGHNAWSYDHGQGAANGYGGYQNQAQGQRPYYPGYPIVGANGYIPHQEYQNQRTYKSYPDDSDGDNNNNSRRDRDRDSDRRNQRARSTDDNSNSRSKHHHLDSYDDDYARAQEKGQAKPRTNGNRKSHHPDTYSEEYNKNNDQQQVSASSRGRGRDNDYTRSRSLPNSSPSRSPSRNRRDKSKGRDADNSGSSKGSSVLSNIPKEWLVAGAVLGVIGAGVAGKKTIERKREKRREEMRAWEEQHGRD